MRYQGNTPLNRVFLTKDSGGGSGNSPDKKLNGISELATNEISLTHSTISLTPSVVFEKALAYMAARWLCIGAINRDQIAREYCEAPENIQKKGITLRRVDQKKLIEHNRNLFYQSHEIADSFDSDIRKGQVSEEFLLPEEIIPYAALDLMSEWCRASFSQYSERVKCGNFTNEVVQSSSFRYLLMTDRGFQNFGLPHHMAKSTQDEELKIFFMKLDSYAGHPWDAKTDYFDSPTFSSGMGDAGAEQLLYLFSNGSFVHICYTGKYYTQSGLYVPQSSTVDIHTPQSRIESDIKISYFDYLVAVPIEKGQSYVDFEGKVVTVDNDSLLIATCESIPEYVLESKKASPMDPTLKYRLFRRSDANYPSTFLVKTNELEKLDCVWYHRGHEHHFDESNVIVNLHTYPQKIKAIKKDTILARGGFLQESDYATTGSVVSQNGNNISNENSSKLVFIQQDNKPALIGTIQQAIEMATKVSN